MFPLVQFDSIPLGQANECLSAWGHKMGEIHRGNSVGWSHGLFHEGRIVGVVVASSLIRECVGGGMKDLTRENTIELSRLCSERKDICRVLLRLWREFVFPFLGYEFAISYQDADLHNGNLYRFDGWERIARSRSGVDTRSGRKGRDKWIWIWRKNNMKVNRIYQLPHPALKVGTPCIVRKDDGTNFETVTTSDPWQLGHGQWVVKVKGISGGYDVERVRLAKEETK